MRRQPQNVPVQMLKKKDKHTVQPFPGIRKATVDLLKAASRKNMIHSLVEVDISEARKKLRQLKRETKGYLSFTGYVIHCVAKAIDENKNLHAYRNRKNQLILFDAVDVSTTIERLVEGKKEVIAMIIRGANAKSVREISAEIKTEKQKNVQEAEVYHSMKLFLIIPPFIRRFIFQLLDKSPHFMKHRAGTIW